MRDVVAKGNEELSGDTSSPPVKILYIAGWGRSGTTILANILGQVEGFFSTGEVTYLAERGLEQNRLCGCGRPFHECSTWQAILQEAFGESAHLDPKMLNHIHQHACRTRHFPLLLTAVGREYLFRKVEDDLHLLHKLYKAIFTVTGCDVIVDSSKNPAYAAWLSMLPFDLYVIHMVRDARASAYSWQRKKLQPDTERMKYMSRMSIVRSSIMWNAYAGMAEALEPHLSHYMRIRYRDFATNPRKTTQEILSFLGEVDSELPFCGENEVEIAPTHTVSGNPNRFQTGVVRLRFDDQWLREMRPHHKWLVLGLTWPLLRRFGFILNKEWGKA